MKIFISHPMTGLTQKEILDLREKAITQISNKYKDAEIIDSYLPQFQDTKEPLIAISESIKLLNEADLVIFITYSNVCYQNSKGCQIEELCCDLYQIKKDYLIL